MPAQPFTLANNEPRGDYPPITEKRPRFSVIDAPIIRPSGGPTVLYIGNPAVVACRNGCCTERQDTLSEGAPLLGRQSLPLRGATPLPPVQEGSVCRRSSARSRDEGDPALPRLHRGVLGLEWGAGRERVRPPGRSEVVDESGTQIELHRVRRADPRRNDHRPPLPESTVYQPRAPGTRHDRRERDARREPPCHKRPQDALPSRTPL